MAELILTDEEKQAISYINDWSDESLGKLLKKVSLQFIKIADEQDKIVSAAAALYLLGTCVEADADSLEISVNDYEFYGKPHGDWLVNVKKIK